MYHIIIYLKLAKKNKDFEVLWTDLVKLDPNQMMKTGMGKGFFFKPWKTWSTQTHSTEVQNMELGWLTQFSRTKRRETPNHIYLSLGEFSFLYLNFNVSIKLVLSFVIIYKSNTYFYLLECNSKKAHRLGHGTRSLPLKIPKRRNRTQMIMRNYIDFFN